MLDLMVELGQRLDPSGKDSFRAFESLEPFQTMMIGTEDDMCPKQVVPKVLESSYDC